MATLITAVFCLFTIQAFSLMDKAAADPTIDIDPTEISLGISSALDINCTFWLKSYPTMAALVSLSLSRADTSTQKFEELAVITEFSPDSANLVTQEKVSATGVNSQTGESYLHLKWEYPTATQEGVYQCAAHGLDMLGHNVELTNISTVTVAEANLNDIFEKLKEIETHEKTLENTISSLENKLENKTSSMENHIQSLENTVTQLRNIVHQLERIGAYNDKEYYMFRENFQDINESLAVCKLCGGTLIEINDENEYNAIVRFLKNVNSDIKWVMIGGTDEQSEGNWVLPSTNQPLPYTAWLTGHPTVNTALNCMYLYTSSSWQMSQGSCHRSSPYVGLRASCEIPAV